MNDILQVDENIRIAAEAKPDSLTEDELETVRKVAKKYRGLMTIPCTGCNYCMPCPTGVDIPGCFDLYNSNQIFGGANDSGSKHKYLLYQMGILGERSSASLCVDCGKCKELCPQQIDIPLKMKDVEAQFEQPAVKIKASAMRTILPVFRHINVLKYR